ncbi:MAG TPA: hypothetical protein PLL09_04785 [Flavobacterium sp.]|uniref:hypothetical protein n=1 Tax=unclassified Flavobacterium TaxID=196869 RepID=UPI0025BB1F31|nr:MULTISPECIES: hypothetical protein [unclassified Flavobacterium]HRE77125.1 hypothetical protein [Flavobacterium sp.]
MGQAKKRMLELESENDLEDFLSQILDSNIILHPAVSGIARQVLDKGVESMSERQKNVIDNFVNNFKNDHSCNGCVDGNIGSLTDYIYIFDNSDNLCPTCQNSWDKLMKE